MASAPFRRLTATLFLAASALAVRDELDGSAGVVHKRTWSGHYYIPFPVMYNSIFKDAKHLGSGSFGESWAVTDNREGSQTFGQVVVVKILYIEEDGNYMHLTWRLVQSDGELWEKVEEAAVECEIAHKIQAGGRDLAAQGKPHIGAKRIMGCYGHNVPMTKLDVEEAYKNPDAPLYLVLENCGAKPLTDYVNAQASDKPLMMNLFKQLLEGLDFMASLHPPWIHHDLKPDNVVVKEEADGSKTLHLIDFGATTQVTEKDKCHITASTGAYAPADWQFPAPSCGGRQGVANFRTICGEKCGTAFDMFAAGVIFMEMAWTEKTRRCEEWDDAEEGQLCYKVMADLRGAYDGNDDELNYQQLERWGTKEAVNLRRLIRLDDADMSKVFNAVAQTLRMHPARRPTAAELLALDAFAVIRTPGATAEEVQESPAIGNNIAEGVQVDHEVEEGEGHTNVMSEGQAIVGAQPVLNELGVKAPTGPKCPKVMGKDGKWIECNNCDQAMETKGKRNVRKKFFLKGKAVNAVVCLVTMDAVKFGFTTNGNCKPQTVFRGMYKLICAGE